MAEFQPLEKALRDVAAELRNEIIMLHETILLIEMQNRLEKLRREILRLKENKAELEEYILVQEAV